MHTVKLTCRGPRQIPQVHHPAPRGSKQVVNILVDLMSSTMLYQNRCQAPARNHPAQCQESVPVCDREEHRFVGKEGGSLVDHLGPSGTAMAGPGFKGVLQKAVQAVQAGKSSEFLDDYLENNPETVTQLTNKALQSLSDYFHEKPGTTTYPTTAAPLTTTNEDLETPMTDERAEEMPALPDLTKNGMLGSLGNPWIVAAGAAAIAISCSGIAMGALCHAQLLQSQAREPLLDANGGGAAASAAGGQEMESASFTPPTMVQA